MGQKKDAFPDIILRTFPVGKMLFDKLKNLFFVNITDMAITACEGFTKRCKNLSNRFIIFSNLFRSPWDLYHMDDPYTILH